MSEKITGFEKEILGLIKRYFDSDSKLSYCSANSSSKLSYYLKDIDKHFYEEMNPQIKEAYEKGRGSELKGKNPKMAALRSSSAMTYNIFGNYQTFQFENKSFYEKHFEFTELKTLVNSNAPANMDVFLKGKEKYIFLEMKMCEWLFNKSSRDISISYFNPKNYSNSKGLAKCAIACLNKLSINELYNYDALQMFKHTLGIYNYIENTKDTPSKIELINCIWDFNDVSSLSKSVQKKYEKLKNEEQDGFKNFYNCMKPFVELFKDNLHIEFSIRKMSVKELCNNLKIENESDIHKDFIKRYLF